MVHAACHAPHRPACLHRDTCTYTLHIHLLATPHITHSCYSCCPPAVCVASRRHCNMTKTARPLDKPLPTIDPVAPGSSSRAATLGITCRTVSSHRRRIRPEWLPKPPSPPPIPPDTPKHQCLGPPSMLPVHSFIHPFTPLSGPPALCYTTRDTPFFSLMLLAIVPRAACIHRLPCPYSTPPHPSPSPTLPYPKHPRPS